MAFKYNTLMPHEPIKVSAKAFLVNLAPSKPKDFPLRLTMVAPHVATKYGQISLKQILKSWQLCDYKKLFNNNMHYSTLLSRVCPFVLTRFDFFIYFIIEHLDWYKQAANRTNERCKQKMYGDFSIFDGKLFFQECQVFSLSKVLCKFCMSV